MRQQRQRFVRGVVMLGLLGLSWATAATWTVTKTADTDDGTCDADCSLREAINAASNGDAINFVLGLAGETITLASHLPDITIDNLTIDASALGGKVTIDGGDNYRIFSHTGSGTFAINNLMVTNGLTFVRGGGIYSEGDITVTESTISGNTAVRNGGGIYGVGIITVTNSEISGNTAFGNGGGIFSDSVFTVTGSTIKNNTANFGGGIDGDSSTVTNSEISGNTANESGGGIHSSGGNFASVTVTGSTIKDNTATNGNGGGIHAIFVTIINSEISGNTAEGNGGGILSANNFGSVTVTGSTIKGNTANMDGGGIFSSGNATVTNSTISVNSARDNGGGIFSSGSVTVTDNTIISGNTTSGGSGGGGIYGDGAPVTVTDSTIKGNEADFGGGIYSSDALITITNSEISSNTADRYGGGIRGYGSATLTLSGCVTIQNNTGTGTQWNVVSDTVTADGMTLAGVEDADYRGPNCPQTIIFGGLAAKTYGDTPFTISASATSSLGVTFTSATAGVCTVSNTTPSNAEVTILATGMCTINADQTGDATYAAAPREPQSFTVNPAASLVVINNNDSGFGSLRKALTNIADGGTITFAADLEGQTITLVSDLSEITVANLTIDASALSGKVTIDGDGNRIFFHIGTGTFAINNLVVTKGKSDAIISGGGIFSSGNVTVTNSIISDNKTTFASGGGIFSGGDVTVIDSEISGNTADRNGGGIRSSGGGIFNRGDVTVTNSIILENTATDDGGGIFSNGNVTVTSSTLSGNSATFGGGIFGGDVTVTLIDSTITGNTANNSVGGVNSGLDIVFSGCTTIANNTAPTNSQWYADGAASDDNGTLDSTRDDPYVGCPTSGSVINPDPDIQIRNGVTTAAASITSGSAISVGSFKRGEVATVAVLVRNPGAQVLELGELSLPSFLSNAGDPLPATLASFGSVVLTLTVDTGSAGVLTGEFSLASNDPDSFENPFVITVMGNVSNTPANVLNILPGIDLGDVTAAAGEQNVVLLSFKLQVPAGSTSVTIDSLTLAASNTGIERASNLRLYIDGGTRGELDNRDVFLASMTDTETLTFNFEARTFSPDVPMWFVVVGDF